MYILRINKTKGVIQDAAVVSVWCKGEDPTFLPTPPYRGASVCEP